MHTVKAIILKSIPHSEQQQILHVYSEERGYMQMITPWPCSSENEHVRPVYANRGNRVHPE